MIPDPVIRYTINMPYHCVFSNFLGVDYCSFQDFLGNPVEFSEKMYIRCGVLEVDILTINISSCMIPTEFSDSFVPYPVIGQLSPIKHSIG